MSRTRNLTTLAIVLAAASASSGSAVAGEKLTVVELFTSQGCSSCPPANANLIKVSNRPDVLALSFGVTYWDYLGWKDIFAAPQYTDRQVSYEPGLGHDGPFTPQIVVNGRDDTVGNRLAEVNALIAAAKSGGGPDITLANGRAAIGAGAGPEGGADVWAVTYDPKVVEVPVGRGENSGRTLPHTHVVHRLTRIGGWSGSAIDLALPAAPAGLRTAVLVQVGKGGPILSAARDQVPGT